MQKLIACKTFVSQHAIIYGSITFVIKCLTLTTEISWEIVVRCLYTDKQ